MQPKLRFNPLFCPEHLHLCDARVAAVPARPRWIAEGGGLQALTNPRPFSLGRGQHKAEGEHDCGYGQGVLCGTSQQALLR